MDSSLLNPFTLWRGSDPKSSDLFHTDVGPSITSSDDLTGLVLTRCKQIGSPLKGVPCPTTPDQPRVCLPQSRNLERVVVSSSSGWHVSSGRYLVPVGVVLGPRGLTYVTHTPISSHGGLQGYVRKNVIIVFRFGLVWSWSFSLGKGRRYNEITGDDCFELKFYMFPLCEPPRLR